MDTGYQPLIISIGDVIGQYKFIETLGKYPTYEKFLAINVVWKFFADIRVYYKAPKISKKVKLENDFMTIANTIDLDHRYCLKFLQKIEERGFQILVFEHSGPSLAEQVAYMNGTTFKFGTVRVLMWQLLHAIELLHESKIICNTLSLENISLLGDYVDDDGYEKKSGERKIQIRLNSLSDAHSGAQWYTKSNSDMRYMAPEALLNSRWSYEVDMWALGVIFVELITGFELFKTDNKIEHLAMIEKLGGEFPSWLLSEIDSNEFSDGKVDISSLDKSIVDRIDQVPTLEEMFKSETMLSFAQVLLSTDPSQRATPLSLYNHPFLHEI